MCSAGISARERATAQEGGRGGETDRDNRVGEWRRRAAAERGASAADTELRWIERVAEVENDWGGKSQADFEGKGIRLVCVGKRFLCSLDSRLMI